MRGTTRDAIREERTVPEWMADKRIVLPVAGAARTLKEFDPLSTSTSQAEIDFENASDDDIINPPGATRQRDNDDNWPIRHERRRHAQHRAEGSH